jgi:hypothetical protein
MKLKSIYNFCAMSGNAAAVSDPAAQRCQLCHLDTVVEPLMKLKSIYNFCAMGGNAAAVSDPAATGSKIEMFDK